MNRCTPARNSTHFQLLLEHVTWYQWHWTEQQLGPCILCLHMDIYWHITRHVQQHVWMVARCHLNGPIFSCHVTMGMATWGFMNIRCSSSMQWTLPYATSPCKSGKYVNILAGIHLFMIIAKLSKLYQKDRQKIENGSDSFARQ